MARELIAMRSCVRNVPASIKMYGLPRRHTIPVDRQLGTGSRVFLNSELVIIWRKVNGQLAVVWVTCLTVSQRYLFSDVTQHYANVHYKTATSPRDRFNRLHRFPTYSYLHKLPKGTAVNSGSCEKNVLFGFTDCVLLFVYKKKTNFLESWRTDSLCRIR